MGEGAGLDGAIDYHIVNSLGWGSLRPLQAAAVPAVRSGDDCILIAPTAGGKTEAAVFPLLSSMVQGEWRGLTILYVTPLRALLNNLYPRITAYGEWLGRTVGLWHGDVGDTERKRLLAEPPDILLTTPESLEAMLVSRRVDHDRFFSNVRAIVIDELHSFAGSDRGWHLLGVLARLERIAGRSIQRVGLSATVGNPQEIGRWLQEGEFEATSARELRVVSEPVAASAPEPEVMLDFVGSVANAARVIAKLHRGEKRLVFCESRRVSEQIAFELRELGVETFVSHSSLSAEERRRSEQAFAEAQNTVIVATSTLELGIDIGDLDRVIQIDAPRTVASFLQRLGRTGRRPGTTRNTLFLATNSDAFLEAAGLLLLWKRGFVEPITPPPHPLHLTAQQLLALALQEGAYGASAWREWWGDLALMDDAEEVLDYLRHKEFLVDDGGLLMIGPAAEKTFGRRHFMDLLSSFDAEKELRVVAGNKEIGFISPLALPRQGSGENKPILMNGRAWRIENVNWERFEVVVSPVPHKGDVRWHSGAIAMSFELMRAQRDVLLGETPDVPMSRRAVERLDLVREVRADQVAPDRLVVTRSGHDLHFWTWAGLKANQTIRAGLDGPGGESYNDVMVLRGVGDLGRLSDVEFENVLPHVPPDMVDTLKFSAALPERTAVRTLSERFADREGADLVAVDARQVPSLRLDGVEST
ncbi:ATP-dependent Lhr-like helicase [Sediminihabitans luteus]|uniref:ATP-dependent Lhr-like helicase n=1 Tax=Sediminihabitans luteus TaxID=1138585 RepID=A0A2M9CPP5_9CELL|nr:DEAD/DEAH box helicase [Sediminihabitans luteus]PJJ73866.1 ATP-dependent Lhr-like helicase [Sediminihabitans luteus]GII98223.1 ATP-dependent helicase [Sediminihabitans luteus]